jgi:hypothetical protein
MPVYCKSLPKIGELQADMSLPELIYLAMGAMIARIKLEKISTREFNRLQWLQYIFEILRITILWPLVLFIDQFEAWLKSE